MLDASRDKSPDASALLIDTPSDNRLLREAQLLMAGISGFGKAAEEAFSREGLAGTIGKFATSAALGLTMSRFELMEGIGPVARTVGIGMGLGFTADIATHSSKVFGAIRDAWHSDCNWKNDVSTMQNQGGKFIFDSALMTAGGMAGNYADKSIPSWLEIKGHAASLGESFKGSLTGTELHPALADGGSRIPGATPEFNRPLQMAEVKGPKSQNGTTIDVTPASGASFQTPRPGKTTELEALAPGADLTAKQVEITDAMRQVIPNLRQVAPGILRGGEPGVEGLQLLKESGIKTIVAFRDSSIEQERRMAEAMGLNFHHISVNGEKPLTQQQITEFLDLVKDQSQFPIFWHCYHGRERTGAFTAIYRTKQEGWTAEKALAEMVDSGFRINNPKYKPFLDSLKSYLKEPTREQRIETLPGELPTSSLDQRPVSDRLAEVPAENLDTWTRELADKFNAGHVSKEQFNSIVESFPQSQQPLAAAFLKQSLPNASDTLLMSNANSVGQQLVKLLHKSSFDIEGNMRADSEQWKHFYTLSASSPGNLTAYLIRKAMNVEMGIRTMDAIPHDFPDKSGWPIVVTDDLSMARPEQLQQLSQLKAQGQKIVALDLNNFGKGVNFIDFSKGTVTQKLNGLLQEAEELTRARPELQHASPDTIAQAILNGPADRAAQALGALIIRPEPLDNTRLFAPPITSSKLAEYFNKAYKNPKERETAALILRDAAEYFDFKTIATQTRELHQRILSEMGRRAQKGEDASSLSKEALGDTKAKDLLYVIGVDGGKRSGDRAASSSAFMNYIYKTANDMPGEQFVSWPQLQQMKASGRLSSKTVVYLDDAAYEGVQIQKRLHCDLRDYPDVLVALIGSYEWHARMYNGVPGRTLVQLHTWKPFKPEVILRDVPSLKTKIEQAKTEQERSALQIKLDRLTDRAVFLTRHDGWGTYSISSPLIWPYFTADNATASVRDFAKSMLDIGNPREQPGY